MFVDAICFKNIVERERERERICIQINRNNDTIIMQCMAYTD